LKGFEFANCLFNCLPTGFLTASHPFFNIEFVQADALETCSTPKFWATINNACDNINKIKTTPKVEIQAFSPVASLFNM
jgi:hypothetical protein